MYFSSAGSFDWSSTMMLPEPSRRSALNLAAAAAMLAMVMCSVAAAVCTAGGSTGAQQRQTSTELMVTVVRVVSLIVLQTGRCHRILMTKEAEES